MLKKLENGNYVICYAGVNYGQYEEQELFDKFTMISRENEELAKAIFDNMLDITGSKEVFVNGEWNEDCSVELYWKVEKRLTTLEDAAKILNIDFSFKVLNNLFN